jgi:hypothetical protein
VTPEEIKKAEQHIDGMSQMEMAELWRFAPAGHPYFDRTLPLFERFDKRFTELGRFTPAVSKAVGWER